ncbi:uncharacterized protein ATNIH1004_010082 [Aspergillus tanneri]|uniref:catalase n=1 Tax=Aspergillus tanneri TaxID=1220188 RepID=A0A5M9M8E0_9EURO|nr:uncharacterized protein ATNIH1004_010082 [Aspergillus tanneri]KAA8643315.1 hypothetical protein ATNIH1004_010082 [Aspergillus tanneri]
MMQGFGANTFVPVNKEGKRHFVKFLWIPHLGVHSLVWDESLKLAGQDPDSHRKDLIEAIDNKAYPKWAFAIQVIPEEKQGHFVFAILVATKIWPEELVDVAIELHIANHTQSHVVPGIDFSDDPLRQGRKFSYFDTQISRLDWATFGRKFPSIARCSCAGEGISSDHGKRSKHLSQMKFPPSEPTIASLRITIIIGDRYDPVAFNGIKTAVASAGALSFDIGMKRSLIYAHGESKESAK